MTIWCMFISFKVPGSVPIIIFPLIIVFSPPGSTCILPFKASYLLWIDSYTRLDDRTVPGVLHWFTDSGTEKTSLHSKEISKMFSGALQVCVVTTPSQVTAWTLPLRRTISHQRGGKLFPTFFFLFLRVYSWQVMSARDIRSEELAQPVEQETPFPVC